jgi:hypothetical protein
VESPIRLGFKSHTAGILTMADAPSTFVLGPKSSSHGPTAFSISPRLIWFPGNQPPGPVKPMFAMKEAEAAALAILPTLFVGVAAARR